MSWNFENTGTPEEVNAALDEALANPHGMPASVGAYLKDAIAACAPPEGQRSLVSVKSTGHRPMAGCGSSEVAEVKLLKRGPWKATP